MIFRYIYTIVAESIFCAYIIGTRNHHKMVWLFTDLVKTTLNLDDKIRQLAEQLYQQKSLIVMGRGFNYATCLEGALVCWLITFQSLGLSELSVNNK